MFRCLLFHLGMVCLVFCGLAQAEGLKSSDNLRIETWLGRGIAGFPTASDIDDSLNRAAEPTMRTAMNRPDGRTAARSSGEADVRDRSRHLGRDTGAGAQTRQPAGTLNRAGDWSRTAVPFLRAGDRDSAGLQGSKSSVPRQAALTQPEGMAESLTTSEAEDPVGRMPASEAPVVVEPTVDEQAVDRPAEPGNEQTIEEVAVPEGENYRLLQIKVDHDNHLLKLYGITPTGQRKELFQAKVGLGDKRSFPTPAGQYFVTHIYDDDPWWIPPPNRAWAWGQSPSKRVYGGTMAPLLKKRSGRRDAIQDAEDLIARKVTLEDYGYRFHGTNAPRSIGRNESHGCIRMLPKDAAELAKLIMEHIGTVGRGETENGTFAMLKAPVRLTIFKKGND